MAAATKKRATVTNAVIEVRFCGVCGARTKDDTPCQHDKISQQNGRCYNHGKDAGRPISTGAGIALHGHRDKKTLLEKQLKKVMADCTDEEFETLIQQELNQPDLYSLERQFAILSLLQKEARAKLKTDPDNAVLLTTIDLTRKLFESQARIALARQELLSKKQTGEVYAVLESIFALCIDPETGAAVDMPVSAVLDQLRERLFNFRAVAQLPEAAIEAEIVSSD